MTASIQAGALPWGRHYLVVEPTAFRVDYAINPFMDPRHQPDPVRTAAEWAALTRALTDAGARVRILDQRPDSPDMVYAMNLGLVVGDRMVLSHMRHPQRRQETATAAGWATEQGLAPRYVGRDGVGAHFEAGDAFPWRGDLLLGVGPRSEQLAAKHLATELEVTVRVLRVTHPGMYHLDLSFCPLDEQRAMVCPDALDGESARALLDLVPEPLVLTEAEAMTFCANSVVVGRTVVMPACPPRVQRRLEDWGFEVVVVEVGEFLKGGGAVRCLTNPLDIQPARDLAPTPGGRVVLP